MATIVNTPPSGDSSGNNLGTILGLLALAVLAYLFFVYGIPAIRGGTGTSPSQRIELNNQGGSGGQGGQPATTGSADQNTPSSQNPIEQNFNFGTGQAEPTGTNQQPTSSSLLPTSSVRVVSPSPSL